MSVNPVTILILHDKADQETKDYLAKHLRSLVRNGKIKIWNQNDILPGSDKNEAIQDAFSKADVVLPLISADLVESNLWEYVELCPRAKLRPVLVRAVSLAETSLKDVSLLPANGKPIAQWKKNDHTPYKEITQYISGLVGSINTLRNSKKSWDSIPPEFQEIDVIFQKNPDEEKVMKHIHFTSQEGKPASAAHFAVYAKMLQEIRERMASRERGRDFYPDNLKDARQIQAIGSSILEKAKLLKIENDLIGLNMLSRNIESVSKEFILDFAIPEHDEFDKMNFAKAEYVEPFCSKIMEFEKKLDTLSAHRLIDVDYSDLSPN
jgi:hypothetical protein